MIAVEVHASLAMENGPEMSTRAAGVTLLLPISSAPTNVAKNVSAEQRQRDRQNSQYDSKHWVNHCSTQIRASTRYGETVPRRPSTGQVLTTPSRGPVGRPFENRRKVRILDE